MRAVGYIRISDEERAREGYGLASQERSIRSYCEAKGWELLTVYTDAGKSGGSLKGRDALEALLRSAAAREFDGVVFWKLDRLGRRQRDLLTIYEQLEATGVQAVSIQESFDTGSAHGRMFRDLLGVFAEFERETIRERITAGLAEKQRQGKLVGPVPLGYLSKPVFDGVGKVVGRKIEVDSVTSPLVRETFARYATGQYSMRDLAQWAAHQGFKSVEGNPLDKNAMRKLLTTATYAGLVTQGRRKGGKVVAKGQHPAIIEETTFNRVQDVMAHRRRSNVPSRPFGRQPYPLSGVAVCAYDGAPLLGLTAGYKKLQYYRCSTAHRQGRQACPQPMVTVDIVEAQIGAYVSGIQLSPEFMGAVVAELRQRRRSVPRTDTAKIQKELDRWKRLYVLGDVDEGEYQKETAMLRKRLAEAEQPAPEVLDVERAVYGLRDVSRLWATAGRERRRGFVREVFDQITVKGPQVEALTPKPLYGPLFHADRNARFGGIMVGVDWLPKEGENPNFCEPYHIGGPPQKSQEDGVRAGLCFRGIQAVAIPQEACHRGRRVPHPPQSSCLGARMAADAGWRCL